MYSQPDVRGAAPQERGAAGEECEQLLTMVLGNGICGVPQHRAPISLAGSCMCVCAMCGSESDCVCASRAAWMYLCVRGEHWCVCCGEQAGGEALVTFLVCSR